MHRDAGPGRRLRADGGIDFGRIGAPGQVEFDDSLMVAQTVDATGAGGVRIYRLNDDDFAFTAYSRDPRSGSGWSESLVAKGCLELAPVELDPETLRDTIEETGGGSLSEAQAAAVLDAYEDRCGRVIEEALLDDESDYEIVLRGMTAYVEEFGWPGPLVKKLQDELDKEQLEVLGKAILAARLGVDDDSWSQLRGHYVAVLMFTRKEGGK